MTTEIMSDVGESGHYEGPPPERRKPGRPRDPSADRRILAAAREVVAEHGVRGASMSAIADRAGVSKPTIYLRWPNLRAVVEAALEDVWANPGTSPHDRLLLDNARLAVGGLMESTPHGRFLAEAAVLPSALDLLAERRAS